MKRLRSLIFVCALTAAASSFAAPGRYDIGEYGASGDGVALNTPTIQKAIDDCAAAGGGMVVIPKGEYLSGALFLKPGVNFELLEGAVLKGSTNIEDYPKINTRIEGHFEPWRVALLNADHADGLRIYGPGTLDGNGAPYWAEFWKQRKINPKVTNLAVERPRLVLIQNSADVQIKDVQFKDSGFWNLHLYHCHRISVERCDFQAPNDPPPNHAPSSDGIDVDSCQDVEIQGCTFSVGDDCIALKGSKGPQAMSDSSSPPVERVHISDCTFNAGGAVVTFGSEATKVQHVRVEHCTIVGHVPLLRLKLRPDTGQLYEDIVCHDITGQGAGPIFNVAPWKQFFDLHGEPPPSRAVRGVTISKVTGTFSSLGRIVGNPGDEISEIVLKDVNVQVKDDRLETPEVKALKFENVLINGKAASATDVSVTPAASPSPQSWNTF